MRITGRQLRRIIQEEVERMMSEEDVTKVNFTQPAPVKGQGTGALPAAVTKEAAASQVANRIAKACFSTSALGTKVKPGSTSSNIEFENSYDLDLKDGDRVEVKGQVVDVKSFDPKSLDSMKMLMGPDAARQMQEAGYAVYDFSSLTINGQPYRGPATQAYGALRAKGMIIDMLDKAIGRQSTSGMLPEDSRMAVYASFTVPTGFTALVEDARLDIEAENLKNPPSQPYYNIRKMLRAAVLSSITIQ